MRPIEHVALQALAGSLGTAFVVAVLAPGSAFFPALGLAGVLGAVAGALLGLAQLPFVRVPPRGALVFWIGVGVALGVLLAVDLGAFQKLRGPHARLAMATLAASGVGGLALGGLLAALQPARDGTFRLGALGARQRLLLALGLVAGSLIGATLEASARWLVTYPSAQRALVGASWLAASIAVRLGLGALPRFRRAGSVAGAWAAIVLAGALRGFLATPEEHSRFSRMVQVEYVTQALRVLTDVDLDGASALLGGGDCAPFDPAVSPRAKEIPGNGIDDNCSFGDAPAVPLRSREVVQEPLAPPPVNVLLVTVDALRADHTTPYGYARDTTPNLARFARTALRFENAYSPGGWTTLSVAAMFAGVYPRKLTWKNEPFRDPLRSQMVMVTLPVDDGRWMLPTALRARGMRAVAILSHDHLLLQARKRGWDRWEAMRSPSVPGDTAVTDLALETLAELGPDPFFLWVHYYNPHEPSSRYPNAPVWGETMVDRYDHEIAATDIEIGRLLEAVEQRAGRPTAVLLGSDHGEILFESTQGHGVDVLEDSTRIPLLLREPGTVPAVIDTPVSLIDVAPTVLALTGTPVPPGLDGQDLRRVRGDRAVVSDLWRLDGSSKAYIDQIAVINRTHRLVFDRIRNASLLVRARDLGRPPTELHLAEAPSLLRETLGRYLDYGVGP
ncbi:MAG: sulfatase-like hydrolase/transferase [Pseudomonadota bacterium]